MQLEVANCKETNNKQAEEAAPQEPPVKAKNAAPVKLVYPDVSAADFSVDDWAEELAEKAEQGLHIYPALPKEFSATCRVLVCDTSDSGEMCIAVMAFSEKDILSAASI